MLKGTAMLSFLFLLKTENRFCLGSLLRLLLARTALMRGGLFEFSLALPAYLSRSAQLFFQLPHFFLQTHDVLAMRVPRFLSGFAVLCLLYSRSLLSTQYRWLTFAGLLLLGHRRLRLVLSNHAFLLHFFLACLLRRLDLSRHLLSH